MRLIDADALKKDDELTEWITRDAIRTGKMLKAFSELFIKKIDECPTIIKPCEFCRNNHTSICGNCEDYDEYEQGPSRDIKEIAEIMKCGADAETKCKMISNILTAKPHYFAEQEPTSPCDLCKFNTKLMLIEANVSGYAQGLKESSKTGHWIKIVVNGQHKIKCDKCDYVEAEYATHIRNYCPNCGAKMVEPQESEEV